MRVDIIPLWLEKEIMIFKRLLEVVDCVDQQRIQPPSVLPRPLLPWSSVRCPG